MGLGFFCNDWCIINEIVHPVTAKFVLGWPCPSDELKWIEWVDLGTIDDMLLYMKELSKSEKSC